MNNSDITFDHVARAWDSLRRVPGERWPMAADAPPDYEGLTILEAMKRFFGPEQRWWYHACANQVRKGPPGWYELPLAPQPPIRDLLDWLTETDAPRWNVACAHLDVAQALARHARPLAAAGGALSPVPQEERDRIAAIREIPPQLASRLEEEMRGRRSDRRSEWPTIPVVETFDHNGRRVKDGTLATLTLDLLPNGSGEFYPSPAMAFVMRDEEFRKAEANAKAYVREKARLWPDGVDVCWTLTRPGDPLPLDIEGPSAGGGMALGVAKLLASTSAAFAG